MIHHNLKSSILSPSHEENFYLNTSLRTIKLPFPPGIKRATLYTGFILISAPLPLPPTSVLSHNYFLCPSMEKFLGGMSFD